MMRVIQDRQKIKYPRWRKYGDLNLMTISCFFVVIVIQQRTSKKPISLEGKELNPVIIWLNNLKYISAMLSLLLPVLMMDHSLFGIEIPLIS